MKFSRLILPVLTFLLLLDAPFSQCAYSRNNTRNIPAKIQARKKSTWLDRMKELAPYVIGVLCGSFVAWKLYSSGKAQKAPANRSPRPISRRPGNPTSETHGTYTCLVCGEECPLSEAPYARCTGNCLQKGNGVCGPCFTQFQGPCETARALALGIANLPMPVVDPNQNIVFVDHLVYIPDFTNRYHVERLPGSTGVRLRNRTNQNSIDFPEIPYEDRRAVLPTPADIMQYLRAAEGRLCARACCQGSLLCPQCRGDMITH